MNDVRPGEFVVRHPAGNAKPQSEIVPVHSLLFGGLLLFFLFEYVRPGTYFPVLETLKLNTVIPVAVFVLTLISSNGRPQSHVLKALNTKWFLFFIAMFPIQVLFVDVKLYVFEVFQVIVGYLLIYYVILRQVTDIKRIKSVFAVLAIIHVLLISLNPDVVLHPEVRNYIMGVTFLGDGNDFAWSTCIVIPMTLFLAQSSDGKIKKILFYGLTVVLVMAVIATQSRGASIALGASIIYLVMRGHSKARGMMWLVVLVGIVMMFAPQAYFDRMDTIKDFETEGSAQGRIMAWKSAMRMAVDHPVIGVGAGHFGVKFGVEYRPPGVGRTEMPWLNAHSIYFLTLGEYGFTGIIFLLGIIISNLLRNEKTIASVRKIKVTIVEDRRILTVAMQASLIGFTVGGAFLSGLYYPHLYILAALSESCFLIAEKETAES